MKDGTKPGRKEAGTSRGHPQLAAWDVEQGLPGLSGNRTQKTTVEKESTVVFCVFQAGEILVPSSYYWVASGRFPPLRILAPGEAGQGHHQVWAILQHGKKALTCQDCVVDAK